MTLAKPVYHGNVYEVTLHDFRDVYRGDRDLDSTHCIHRTPTQTADRLGFSYSAAGKSGFTRNVYFPAQTNLYATKVIPFDQIQRTNVTVEIESITTDKYMGEDWMVFSFATAVLEDDLISFLDIRSTSKLDIRTFRFRSKSTVVPYVKDVISHYEQLHAAIDVAFPNTLEKYIPPDELA